MKVLHIGKYFPPFAGGMENYLRDLMVAQTEQGIDSTALVHQSHIGLRSCEETFDTGKQKLRITRAAVWARVLFTPISPTFGWLLHRHLKQTSPDILHLHMPNVSVFWTLLLPGARKIPWVVHWHADVLASRHSLGLRIFYNLYRPLERSILRHSKAIISTTPPYLQSSEPLQDFREKCQVIPLGLSPDNFPDQESSGNQSHEVETLRVLAVGRLSYYKGFEYLIEATAHCENIELHLVGNGEQLTKLVALSSRLGLDQQVHFHTKLSDAQLHQQYQRCDCLCLPSIERTEAFGMVLLEAMYQRKATIVSDVPGSGMGWVVDDGITGLHVPPQDIEALAHAMRNLLQNRDKIVRFGANGRDKFDREFHIRTSSALIGELYGSVRNAQASANN